jgi:hypothetical protein
MSGKKYVRHLSKYQISRENSQERKDFEAQIISKFLSLYVDENELNIKVPRDVFKSELDEIGTHLQLIARKIVLDPDENRIVHKLLKDHPVPEIAKGSLPDEFRVFCLLLNALKQWVSAEQAATDRVLLGGEVRKKLKANIPLCIVSGKELEYKQIGAVNFHHTMRDGRFPIPLTKEAHDMIEGQIKK